MRVAGGFDESSPLDSVERFDVATNKWTTIAAMLRPRGGVGVDTLAGKIYAAGGHDGNRYLSSVETYDPLTGRFVDQISHQGPVTKKKS